MENMLKSKRFSIGHGLYMVKLRCCHMTQPQIIKLESHGRNRGEFTDQSCSFCSSTAQASAAFSWPKRGIMPCLKWIDCCILCLPHPILRWASSSVKSKAEIIIVSSFGCGKMSCYIKLFWLPGGIVCLQHHHHHHHHPHHVWLGV